MIKHCNPKVPQGQFAGFLHDGYNWMVCVRVGLRVYTLHYSWVTQLGCHVVGEDLSTKSFLHIRPMPDLAYVR